jgi:hypothetical protein
MIPQCTGEGYGADDNVMLCQVHRGIDATGWMGSMNSKPGTRRMKLISIVGILYFRNFCVACPFLALPNYS